MGVLHRNVTQDISYAHSAESRGGRAVIRLMENTTGRLSLIRRARGYEQEVAAGRDFFEVMVARYGLSLDIRRGNLGAIPAEGPLIVIANHPYGILDGLMMGHLLQQAVDQTQCPSRGVGVESSQSLGPTRKRFE